MQHRSSLRLLPPLRRLVAVVSVAAVAVAVAVVAVVAVAAVDVRCGHRHNPLVPPMASAALPSAFSGGLVLICFV